MRRVLPVGVAAGLVAAPGASSRSGGFVTIRGGDEVRIAGTHTGCVVQELAVFCIHYTATSPPKQITPVAGSYGTLAFYLERAVIAFRAGAAGKTATVFQRKPAGMPAFDVSFYPEPADRVVRLKVGQVARVEGSKLDCAVVRAGARNVPTVYCVTDDKVGPVPKSYATLASDDGIAIGVIGANRRTTIIYTRRQP